MSRIMIVEDYSIVLEGLRRILEGRLGIEIVAVAVSGQEALDLAASMELDIVILDIDIQGRYGLEVLKELKTLKPALGVIILSVRSEEHDALRCLKAGAGAYISRKISIEELIRAVYTIAEGKPYVTISVAERMVALLVGDLPSDPHEKLSDRELRVLLMIGTGMSLTKIAEELFLSPKTVSAYKTRILKKMGLENSASLIRYVFEKKFL